MKLWRERVYRAQLRERGRGERGSRVVLLRVSLLLVAMSNDSEGGGGEEEGRGEEERVRRE